jgi:hypothetical protein
MALYQGGPVDQYTSFAAGVIPNDVFGVAINWFVNRTPLVSRLAKLPVGSNQFLITNDNYRPRSTALTGAYSLAGTTLVVADATIYDIGDVLQCQSEYFLVTGTPNAGSAGANATTIVVTYGYAGSANATHASGQILYTRTNTRTGAEINVSSVSRLPQAVIQQVQTVQHAYQIGGALQANQNYTVGFNSPLDRDRLLAMQHTMDDFESSIYYGVAVPLTATGTRPMMAGLASGTASGLIKTNYVSTPANAAAYKPSDLVRDTLQAAFNGGGNPTVLIVSTDFLTGMAVWGHAAMRLPAGENVYGTPIDVFKAPFLQDITIIPAPLLQPGSAICLSDPEVRIRLKRPMIDKPRGSRGDAYEGDIIMEGAIELDNEAHHSFVTGVTAFSAS